MSYQCYTTGGDRVTGDITNIIDLLKFMEQKKKSKCPPIDSDKRRFDTRLMIARGHKSTLFVYG